MALPLITQPELARRLSEESGLTQADVKKFLEALNEVVLDAVYNCERVGIASVIVEPALRKAQKARMGRNPQTGEAVKVAAKPASVRIKLTARKPIKDAAPKVATLKRRLAA